MSSSDENNIILPAEKYIPRTRDYYAKLEEFEGPLDILLHFIKEDELDIYNIPISKITKDFLGFIEYAQTLDIELAGEFLVMAAELMKIKARMLLPQFVQEEGELEEDPRMTLVRKLLEYKRFKDATEEIGKFEQQARLLTCRGNIELDPKEYDSDTDLDPGLKNLTILNLIKAYRNVVKSVRIEVVHPIELLDITPETQKEILIEYFRDGKEVDFKAYVSTITRKLEIVCTFLALLQLALEGYLEIIVEDFDRTKFTIRKRNIERTLMLEGHE